MAKKLAEAKTNEAQTLEATTPTMSIEQLIANRTGLGVGIVADMLAKLDAPGDLLGTIDTLTNEQILERLNPAKKAT